RADEVFTFPGRVQVSAAEVTVGGEPAVEVAPVTFVESAQAEAIDDGRGAKVDQAIERILDLLIGQHAGSERLDGHGKRTFLADPIPPLHLAPPVHTPPPP